MPTIKGFSAFDTVKKLIVVAAHADDLETMCGGTIYKLAQQGVEIYTVNCTLGDIGTQDKRMLRTTLATTRIQEAEAAAKLLGIQQVFNLGQPDGELEPTLALRAQIARLYRLTQADTLMTFDPFWAGQIHPDHRAAGQAALDAYMPAKMPLYHPEHLNETDLELSCLERIFCFATDRQPDIFVDITDVYSKKLAACVAHKSQFPKGLASLEWLKKIDGIIGQSILVPYAESFKQIKVW